MHISLTDELESRVKAKVESGMYNNASEVVREALRFMETHDEWVRELKLAQLKQQLQQGINDLDEGNSTLLASEDDLDALIASAKS